MLEGNLLCSTSTDLNVNLMQNHPHGNVQEDVWSHILAPRGPAKLIHKIKHLAPSCKGV